MNIPHTPRQIPQTHQGALTAYMKQLESGAQEGEPQPQPLPPVRQFAEQIVYLFGSDRQRQDIAQNKWRVR